MNAQASRFPYLPLLIINFPAILFCAGGLAVIWGWLPAPVTVSGDISPREYLPAAWAQPVVATALAAPRQEEMQGKARAGKKCAECGVIVSMRAIEGHDDDSGPGAAGGTTAGGRDDVRVRSIKSHEITVRLADGSNRVIRDANPARWRPGERMIIIDGANPSGR